MMSLLANKRSEIHPFWTQARRAPGRLDHVTPTKAVILAHPQDVLRPAGSSSRFVRDSLPPAPLLSVANRPLVAHAVSWLQQAGVREAAVIVPGELAEAVRRAVAGAAPTLDISWLEQVPDETLPWSLGRVSDFLGGEQFVLHMADSVAKQSLASLMSEADDDDVEALLMEDDSNAGGLGQVVELRPSRNGASRTRSSKPAGVAVLCADAIEAAQTLDSRTDCVAEALAEAIRDRGGCVRTRGVRDWWRFRGGGADGLLEGNRFALEGQAADLTEAQVVDSKIQGPVVAHPLARIESSVVRGPAVIGAGAHLRNAYVGPYTSIGDDVLVEGAEIEHSVILAGACISHLGGRLEASVVGPKSKVFRDFRLPRALRLTLGEGAEVSLT
jgi:glucose-1-phosphate thymidylyltransferase